MGFFSKRNATEPVGTGASATETVAAVRLRAKHRLIGAVALVAVAVVVFPLLFESKPRSIPVDLPIEIPKKEGTAPLVLPPPRTEAPSAPAEPPKTAEAVVAPKADAPAPAEPAAAKADAKVEAKAEAKPVPKADAKAEPKPEAKAETKAPTPPPKPDEASRAKALLEGKTPEAAGSAQPAAADSGRFVVQAGAYTDAAKVREVRQKIERSGLKTYAQVVKSAEGERTRVRVGPYPTRAEADKVAAKLKQLGLDAAVLSL